MVSPLSSIFSNIRKRFESIPRNNFGKVDTEQQLNLGQYFTIRSIPTTLIIREELELFRHSGALAQADLVDIIKKLNLQIWMKSGKNRN